MTWTEHNRGIRRHSMMTKALAKKIPPIGRYQEDGEQSETPTDKLIAYVKYFSSYTRWEWYLTEANTESGMCFGLVYGFKKEWGYFHLEDLSREMFEGIVPSVERDLHWTPRSIGVVEAYKAKFG